jgi:hypothetical protein
VAVIVAAAMGAAAAVQQGLTVRDLRRYPPPVLLINVDGHPMHLQVRGHGLLLTKLALDPRRACFDRP